MAEDRSPEGPLISSTRRRQHSCLMPAQQLSIRIGLRGENLGSGEHILFLLDGGSLVGAVESLERQS